MTAVDNLWYLADEADQRAEQTYHRLSEAYDDYIESERSRTVPRSHFKTLAQRICDTGLPYGAHTLAYQPSGELLLVRHEDVQLWVIPGGQLQGEETLLEGARRELGEEAGIDVDYDGLAIMERVRLRSGEYETWGVLPVFAGEAQNTDLAVSDPDDEISEARWFAELPEDTRDREELLEWRQQRF